MHMSRSKWFQPMLPWGLECSSWLPCGSAVTRAPGSSRLRRSCVATWGPSDSSRWPQRRRYRGIRGGRVGDDAGASEIDLVADTRSPGSSLIAVRHPAFLVEVARGQHGAPTRRSAQSPGAPTSRTIAVLAPSRNGEDACIDRA